MIEAFEGASALSAGLDRGAEILAIGATTATLRTVSAITAAEGLAGVSTALGPDTAGTTRVLRIQDAGGIRDVSVTKSDFALAPVSDPLRGEGDRRWRPPRGLSQSAYLHLDPPIPPCVALSRRSARQGVTDIIVDLRYNGGGLVSIAQLMGNLLGGDRALSDVFATPASARKNPPTTGRTISRRSPNRSRPRALRSSAPAARLRPANSSSTPSSPILTIAPR